MKRMTGRLAALLLALLIVCSGAVLPVGAAVSLPDGTTREALQATMPKLEKVVLRLMQDNGGSDGLKAQVYGALYADKTLNEILTGVYGGFADNESTLKTLGVDISPKAAAACLAGFPEVAAAAGAYADWKALIDAGNFAPHWHVDGQGQFSAALAAMFGPLNDLLYTVLCAGEYRPNMIVSVQGGNGYENVIVPLLNTIGCPGVMTQEQFTAAAGADKYAMVTNIVRMVFSALDAIFAAPVTRLCKYLPAIANYLVSGGLSDGIKTLMEPLKVRIAVFSLPGVDKLLESTDMFSSSQDLTKMLSDLDTSQVFGGDVKLTIPEINLEELAACGSGSVGSYQSDDVQAFVTIMRWLVSAAKQNKAQLPALLGDSAAEMTGMLDTFLNKSADELIVLLVRVFNLDGKNLRLDYAWTYPDHTAGTVTFTQNLTRENYTRMLTMADDTFNDFVGEFTDKGSLSKILSEAIYSNRLVGELAKGVFGALDTEDSASLFGMLGIAVTPAGVGKAISGKYGAAGSRIAKAAKWEDVDPAALSWGFADGNKAGFTAAVTTLLRPFAPMLRLLLAEGDYTLLDGIVIPGSNGYETAVIPLLEGIGAPADSIKTYAAYKADAKTDAVLTDILTPVTALLDRLIESPVDVLCGILPNMAYFLTSDMPKQCVENLLHPVKTLVSELGMSELLPAELSDFQMPEIADLFSQLGEGSDLGITLPAPDLAYLASLGNAVEQPSRRTYQGNETVYTYIFPDKPAVLVTVLRYLVGALKSSEGFDIDSMMQGAEDNEMFSMYAGKIGEQLKSMSVDETIEWIYGLLFSETPKKEQTEEPEVIPTIIYKEKKHSKIVPIILGCLLVIALFAGGVVYSRVDFSALLERRRMEKQKKKAALKKQKGGAGEPVPKQPEKENSAPTAVSPSATGTKPAEKQAPAAADPFAGGLPPEGSAAFTGVPFGAVYPPFFGAPAGEGAQPEGFDPSAQPGWVTPEGFDPTAQPGWVTPEGFDPTAQPGWVTPEGFDPSAQPGWVMPQGFDPSAQPGWVTPEGFDPSAQPGWVTPEGFDPYAQPGWGIPPMFDPAMQPGWAQPEAQQTSAGAVSEGGPVTPGSLVMPVSDIPKAAGTGAAKTKPAAAAPAKDARQDLKQREKQARAAYRATKKADKQYEKNARNAGR